MNTNMNTYNLKTNYISKGVKPEKEHKHYNSYFLSKAEKKLLKITDNIGPLRALLNLCR